MMRLLDGVLAVPLPTALRVPTREISSPARTTSRLARGTHVRTGVRLERANFPTAAGRASTRSRPTGFVGAAAGTRQGWDWEADELSANQRAELEELRTQRECLALRIAALEAAVDASTHREKALGKALRQLAGARWPQRRRLKRELRDAGLLDH